MQTKEWWNTKLESIVRPVSKRAKLAVRSSEVLLLKMQPYFVAHLEVVWHPVLIMALLVLHISSIQYMMNLLADVFNALDEATCFVNFRLDVR